MSYSNNKNMNELRGMVPLSGDDLSKKLFFDND